MQLKISNMIKLDLHRTRHEDARPKTIRFVEEHWGSGDEADIVTGNSKKMKDIVSGVLNEYKLKYQISREFDIQNQGYIVVWFE